MAEIVGIGVASAVIVIVIAIMLYFCLRYTIHLLTMLFSNMNVLASDITSSNEIGSAPPERVGQTTIIVTIAQTQCKIANDMNNTYPSSICVMQVKIQYTGTI